MAVRQDSVDEVELTEKLVLTRTRAPDLESVKKLNCWASHISDVSVVRKMPNLEVCSLSINRISSLRDFAHCYKLKELYVRTNKIECLGDIHYLKNLSRLRSLWLSENPCADADNYRLSVLRTLPRLQKLDNAAVRDEEIQEALATVDEIPIPQDFSASSMFHPGLTDVSLSSVSSIDSVLTRDSTNTDIGASKESLPVARKKREQRRQKKAEEESARRSAEEESVRTSLERTEDDIKNNDRMNSSSVDVCSGENDDDEDDDGDNQNNSRNGFEDNDVTIKDENISDGVTSSTDRNKDNCVKKCSLSNRVSDENMTSNSNDDCVSNKSKSVDCDDEGDEGGGDCGGGENIDISKDSMNNKDDEEECDDSNSCNECNDKNRNNNSKDDIQDEYENNSSSKKDNPQHGSHGNSSVTEDSLLDKIRLNDSLAMEDVVHNYSHDSIELDDLVVEIDGENQNGAFGDDCNNNNKNNSDDKDGTVKDKKDDADSKPVFPSPNQYISESTVAAPGCPNSSSSDKTVSPPVENKVENLSKKETVDWEEYNRMRQDIGMRPLERGSNSRPSSANVARARNGNILQAVLSLIKELDKDSLDLVASAAKARSDNI